MNNKVFNTNRSPANDKFRVASYTGSIRFYVILAYSTVVGTPVEVLTSSANADNFNCRSTVRRSCTRNQRSGVRATLSMDV